MSEEKLIFSVDAERLGKLGANFLKSNEGTQALLAGQLKGEERLFVSLLGTSLLDTRLFLQNKKIIQAGEQFEEAYFLTSGEVRVQRGQLVYRLGPGSVLGLAEGMVGLASRYSVTALNSVQVKIIPFHKVDAIVKLLPAELRSILVTIIKRNLATS